jgi:hypothetical protein
VIEKDLKFEEDVTASGAFVLFWGKRARMPSHAKNQASPLRDRCDSFEKLASTQLDKEMKRSGRPPAL